MEEDRFCFVRGDGLVECWIRGKLPRPTQGWLEIVSGEHPHNSDKIRADELIEGEEIAKTSFILFRVVTDATISG